MNVLEANDAQQFLQKRLFGIPFPREQRREAKEKYEERYCCVIQLEYPIASGSDLDVNVR